MTFVIFLLFLMVSPPFSLGEGEREREEEGMRKGSVVFPRSSSFSCSLSSSFLSELSLFFRGRKSREKERTRKREREREKEGDREGERKRARETDKGKGTEHVTGKWVSLFPPRSSCGKASSVMHRAGQPLCIILLVLPYEDQQQTLEPTGHVLQCIQEYSTSSADMKLVYLRGCEALHGSSDYPPHCPFSIQRSATNFQTYRPCAEVHPGAWHEYRRCEVALLAKMRSTSRPVGLQN